MTHRPDHLQAGRQLLELQLAMMQGAMTLMAGSAQRFVELSLGAAASSTRGAPALRPAPTAAASGSAAPHRQPGQLPSAKTARLAPGSKEYTLRMQEEVDSILHAFAMVPDAADRLIRTSALLTEQPGREAESRVRRPAKPATARRPARRQAEHAR